MKRKTFVCALMLLGLGLLPAGCGEDEYWIRILLPEGPAYAQTQGGKLEVFVIKHGPGKSCGPLETCKAKPYEPGYEVEASLLSELHVIKINKTLSGIGNGARLFFARASSPDPGGEVLLLGCKNATTSTSQVDLQLEWKAEMCPD